MLRRAFERVTVMSRTKFLRPLISTANVQNTWIDTLLVFVKWTQGRADLEASLTSLAKYLGADAACISRRDRSKSEVRIACIVDTNTDPRFPRLKRSFAAAKYGEYVDSLKPGAAALLSEVMGNEEVMDPELEKWIFKRGIRDIASICLSSEGGIRDILEFHFSNAAPKKWFLEHSTISQMLVDVFEGRCRGLMTKALLSDAGRYKESLNVLNDGSLLNLDNPAGLTRSEWKVCFLIANGLSRNGVANELSIKSTTISTHLRNIYAKTGSERFHELALRLVSAREQSNLYSNVVGKAA